MENQDNVTAVDASGNAVGSSTSLSSDGSDCVAIWPAGEPGRCLGPGWATDINDHGVVVGQSGDMPAMWTATGELRILPLVHQADTWGRVEAINAHGVMVGEVGVTNGLMDDRAVRWDSPTSAPVELEAEPAGLDSRAWAISDNGVMTGYVTDAGGRSRGVVWRPDGSMRELPVPGYAYGVSDLDAPVGVVAVDGHSRAAVFDPETLQPTIVGPRNSTAMEADGTHIAGWIVTDPDTGDCDLAFYSHPSFDS